MRLGIVIRKYRLMSELGIRELAKEIGTSTATLSRIERGFPADGNTLAKVLVWLMTQEKA